MTTVLKLMLLAMSAAAPTKDSPVPKAAKPPQAAAQTPALPPPGGSRLAPDNVNCFLCHSESDLWDAKSRRLYISKEELAKDVHFQKGVNCQDCHGGNHESQDVNQAHAKEDGFRASLQEIKKSCAHCHKQQGIDLIKGVHDRAGPKNELGQGTPLACDQCHGKVSHHLLSVRDSDSPIFPDNQVKTCGVCHEKDLQSYLQSVHGHGLVRSGLQVTAVCASCHGAHGIYRAADKRSTLFSENVAGTCGKCHRFIGERLQASVHGRGKGAGAMAQRTAPGGKSPRHPTCTSCHQNHEIAFPASARFRLQVPNLCGNCHTGLSNRYAMSLHGELTELGFGPGAKCSDCHGSHDILPVDDPKSQLSPENHLATCQKCHPYAAGNFVDFDPHADYTDASRSPIVHAVYVALLTLLFSVFGFFGLHSVLWFVRGLYEVLRHGRPKALTPGAPACVRFAPLHRAAHAILLVSFLGLALTGLPLKYSHSNWAKVLTYYLGGFDSTSVWHRFFGVITFACFFVYVVLLLRRFANGRKKGTPRWQLLFGPDSLLPTWRDVKDFFKMIRWFVGLGPRPTFERWAYWEKFDFWGATGDVIIIGITGLILWFPNLFCSFLPGITLNIAKVIHSTQALLATGFVFAIHFFNTHLRAEKFPADMSALTGLVSEEEMQHERPELYERLKREGKLDELRTTVPSRANLWSSKLLGFAALGVGLALLAAMIVAGLGG